MSTSYQYPVIMINNNKNYYGQLTLSERGLYFSGHSSLFRHFVSNIIETGREQTCSALYDQITPDNISRKDESISIQVVENSKLLSLSLKAKSSNEALLIVTRLTELFMVTEIA